MISYELAKRLKEVGFPQKKCEKAYYVNAGQNTGGVVDLTAYKEADDEFWLYKLVANPTLSELIEACGEHFDRLHWNRYQKRWEANRFLEVEIEGEKFHKWPEYRDSTPEEAVANLWLALQDKK